VCSTHRMSSNRPQLGASWRSRPSRRRFGPGSKGPTNSPCSSESNFCRFFMREAQHPTRPRREYLP
jgi:hypothetical protein